MPVKKLKVEGVSDSPRVVVKLSVTLPSPSPVYSIFHKYFMSLPFTCHHGLENVLTNEQHRAVSTRFGTKVQPELSIIDNSQPISRYEGGAGRERGNHTMELAFT